MADTLTVEEAAATYVAAMRNVLPAGPGVCTTCHTFIDPQYVQCYPCGTNYMASLDALVPITYSMALGQMHTALRGYKDGTPHQRAFVTPRLTAILWKFLERHEECVARAAGCPSFDIVTTVPSSSPQRDAANLFRTRVAEWCRPVSSRLERLLIPTGEVAGRAFDAQRFNANCQLDGESVLLLDDTWTTGGHAQSAAFTLKASGARHVALVVIGRHMTPEWVPEPPDGETSAELYAGLSRTFDWDTCAVHA